MSDAKVNLTKKRERLLNLLRNTSEAMDQEQYEKMLDEMGKSLDAYLDAARHAIENGEY